MVLARVSAGVCMCRQHSKVIAGGCYTTPSLARMFKSGKCQHADTSVDDRARTTDMAKFNRKTEGSSGTGSPSSVSDSQSSWQLMLSNSRSESASVPFASFDRSHLTAPAPLPAITAPWLTAPAAEGERAAALDKPSCAGRRTGCGGPTCVADGSRSGTEVGVCTCARACPSVRPASLAASFDDLCSLAAGLDTRAVKMPSGIWLR